MRALAAHPLAPCAPDAHVQHTTSVPAQPTLAGMHAPVTCLAISPDKDSIAVGFKSGQVHVIDAHTGETGATQLKHVDSRGWHFL